jgi:hypothetical protein
MTRSRNRFFAPRTPTGGEVPPPLAPSRKGSLARQRLSARRGAERRAQRDSQAVPLRDGGRRRAADGRRERAASGSIDCAFSCAVALVQATVPEDEHASERPAECVPRGFSGRGARPAHRRKSGRPSGAHRDDRGEARSARLDDAMPVSWPLVVSLVSGRRRVAVGLLRLVAPSYRGTPATVNGVLLFAKSALTTR